MKIEVLYPEYCNLYGDTGNIRYLKECLTDANFIYTSLNETPHFCSEEINLIYIGPTTENFQEEIIQLLKPYKDKIIEQINNNVIFLATGNAMEIFGEYVEKPDGSKIEALGIFNIYTKREENDRFNELALGNFKHTNNEEIEIVGFKNQLSLSYGNNESEYFIEMVKGSGINPQTTLEGIRRNNFFGTYLLGPILVINPKFMKHILTLLGQKNAEIPFEDVANKAYEIRLKEFKERI